MTQSQSRLLDDLARLMTDAAGVAQGVRREVDTMMRSQAERMLRDLDVVSRDEFEAVKDMARKAREENDRLGDLVSRLESRLALLERGGLPEAPPDIMSAAAGGVHPQGGATGIG